MPLRIQCTQCEEKLRMDIDLSRTGSTEFSVVASSNFVRLPDVRLVVFYHAG